jgi:hypothetical protein
MSTKKLFLSASFSMCALRGAIPALPDISVMFASWEFIHTMSAVTKFALPAEFVPDFLRELVWRTDGQDGNVFGRACSSAKT